MMIMIINTHTKKKREEQEKYCRKQAKKESRRQTKKVRGQKRIGYEKTKIQKIYIQKEKRIISPPILYIHGSINTYTA